MQTVLVPVDFSETSLNAAAYATRMLTGIYGVHMLLYHVYEKPGHAETTEQELQKLRKHLFDVGIVKTEIFFEQGHDVHACIEKFTYDKKPDMIVMGITTKTKIEQTFIASNSLNLAKKNLCPVLIVPADVKYKKIKNVVLASDFIHSPSPAIATIVKKLLSDFFARLHIVNVNPAHHVSITEPYQKVKNEMNELFKGYEHDFHFIGLYDLPETMNMFVGDHDVDIIITMPKDHSWFSTLLGHSNTKKMGYQSTVPVLAIHQ